MRPGDLRQIGLVADERRLAVAGLPHLRRGSYWFSPVRDVDDYARMIRAVLADWPDAVASHSSAAHLLGLPVERQDISLVHVSLAVDGPGRRGKRHGVHAHYRRVPPAQLVIVDGLKVTSPTRTVIDCARLLPLASGLVIADAALNARLTSLAELSREIAQHRRCHGIATARRVVDLADPLAESPGESRTRLIVREAGYDVESQVELADDAGCFLGRVDLLVRGTRLVLEFDGRAKYSMGETAESVEAAHWAAKVRRDRIENAGYPVLSVVWNDLRRPRLLIQRMEGSLRRIGCDPANLRHRP